MSENHPLSTRDRLILAAAAEFGERGDLGTDTNRIARRAGFAPQTFYRWFRDKAEVFIAVYRAWEVEERVLAAKLDQGGGGLDDLADALIDHHRRHRVFRRVLRRLSLEDAEVRAARAESRLRQIGRVRHGRARESSTSEMATDLLLIERLCDAIAEGELIDMGLDETDARKQLVILLARLSGNPHAEI